MDAQHYIPLYIPYFIDQRILQKETNYTQKKVINFFLMNS